MKAARSVSALIRKNWKMSLIERGHGFPSHRYESRSEGVGAVALKPVADNNAKPEHLENLTKIIDAFLETE